VRPFLVDYNKKRLKVKRDFLFNSFVLVKKQTKFKKRKNKKRQQINNGKSKETQ